MIEDHIFIHDININVFCIIDLQYHLHNLSLLEMLKDIMNFKKKIEMSY